MSTNFKEILDNPYYQEFVKGIKWDELRTELVLAFGTEKHFLYEPNNIYDRLSAIFNLRLFWDKYGIVDDDVARLLIAQLCEKKILEYQESWFGSDSFNVLALS